MLHAANDPGRGDDTPDVFNDATFVVTLDEDEAAAVAVGAKRVGRFDPVLQTEDYILEAKLAAAELSSSLRRRLAVFARFGNRCGGLLIRGVPLGTIPRTPAQADNEVGCRLFAASAMSVIVALLGEQYGFRPELGGKIIQSILPERGAEGSQRSVGSEVYLLDHIEMAFTEHRADYVVLLCVRADHDHEAGTALSSIHDILPLLDAETIEILRRPRFKTTVDESFLIGWDRDEPIWVKKISVLEGARERSRMRVDFAETVGMDPEAQQALDALQAAAQAVRRVIRLEPGDILITDNVAATHGRTPFTPHYDGFDRWLLRTFVTKDLSRSATVRPRDGRVVDPDFRVSLDGRGAA